jgi:hypothetical protein
MVAFADKAPLPSERASVPTGFDVFVLLLTILSLINILLTAVLARQDIVNVVLIVDGVLCLIFLGDFLLRLRR